MEGENGKKRIKLFCPSVSKVVQIIAGEDQKLDLGPISRAFGLDPNTLKLNGYFISRGVDLVASSVTWKSLIGFFSARGLPTGAAGSDSLVVGGKLSKIGSKRSHDVEDGGNGVVNTEEYCRDNKRTQREHCSTPNNERTKSGLIKSNGLCLKRKWWLDDESRLKRTRSTSSDEAASSLAWINGRFSCSKRTKRMRVNETAGSPSSKKIR